MNIKRISDKFLLLSVKLSPDEYAKLAAMPGWSRWEGRELRVRADGLNLDYIIEQWPEARFAPPEAQQIIESHKAMRSSAAATASAKAKPSEEFAGDDTGYTYKRQPMAHQHKAFLLSRDKEAFGLFMEQGTGKTKVIADTANYLFLGGKIEALIVVAWPNGVHQNWVDYELPEDLSVPYIDAYWSSNHASVYKRKEFEMLFKAPPSVLKVFTFNIEAFASERARAYLIRALKAWRCLLVIDQSASIKNPQAKRTKFLINEAAPLAPYRRILDGDPVAEGAEELFSQFKFLDPRIIGHDTWTGFKAEFCEIGFFNEIKGYKNLPVLQERIDGHCFRVLAADCLDLPPRIYKPWSFELSPEERRVFDQLKDKGLAFFDGEFSPEQLEEFCEEELSGDEQTLPSHIEEHRALTKNLRLQQISSGWWPADEFKSINSKDGELPSRMSALLLLLSAIKGEKALIFSRFRADLELIQKVLGKSAVSYHGGISEHDRAMAKKKFMQCDKTLYFIGQPQSAGIGHTLTAAKNVIFYTNSPSLRLRSECEKRAHRKGLKHDKLLVWDLIASGTQDHKIVQALRGKKDLAREILKDPVNFFLQYEDK